MHRFSLIWRNKSGTTAIEYAFIILLIAIAIIGAVTIVGTLTNSPLSKVAGNLASPSR